MRMHVLLEVPVFRRIVCSTNPLGEEQTSFTISTLAPFGTSLVINYSEKLDRVFFGYGRGNETDSRRRCIWISKGHPSLLAARALERPTKIPIAETEASLRHQPMCDSMRKTIWSAPSWRASHFVASEASCRRRSRDGAPSAMRPAEGNATRNSSSSSRGWLIHPPP